MPSTFLQGISDAKDKIAEQAKLRRLKILEQTENVSEYIKIISLLYRGLAFVVSIESLFMSLITILGIFMVSRKVFNVTFTVEFAIFSAGCVFPMTFNVGAAFKRREKALELLATIKSNLISLYLMFVHFDVQGNGEAAQDVLPNFRNLVRHIEVCLRNSKEVQYTTPVNFEGQISGERSAAHLVYDDLAIIAMKLQVRFFLPLLLVLFPVPHSRSAPIVSNYPLFLNIPSVASVTNMTTRPLGQPHRGLTRTNRFERFASAPLLWAYGCSPTSLLTCLVVRTQSIVLLSKLMCAPSGALTLLGVILSTRAFCRRRKGDDVFCLYTAGLEDELGLGPARGSTFSPIQNGETADEEIVLVEAQIKEVEVDVVIQAQEEEESRRRRRRWWWWWWWWWWCMTERIGEATSGYGCASAYLVGLLFTFIVFALYRYLSLAFSAFGLMFPFSPRRRYDSYCLAAFRASWKTPSPAAATTQSGGRDGNSSSRRWGSMVSRRFTCRRRVRRLFRCGRANEESGDPDAWQEGRGRGLKGRAVPTCCAILYL
eukprot:753040-Hanusia_phi.AAC.4